jgi:hypothetical protein
MLVHSRPLGYRGDTFGRWWTASQSAVRPDGTVVAAPSLDQDLGLAERVKDFAIEQLVTEAGVEVFAAAVFPR